MCLVCKYNKPNVAMGDIVCYKWMKKTKWIDMLLTKRRYKSPIYGKFTWKFNEEYYQPFAKVRRSDTTFWEKGTEHDNINHGIYIDVFPLDGYPKLG